MSEGIGELIHDVAVKVHIVKDDTRETHKEKPKQPKEVRATFQSFTVSNTSIDNAVCILRHAPNRRRAIIQFVTGGPVALASTKADAIAQGSSSALWATAAAGPIVLETTNEVWANSSQAGSTTVSVIAEYDEV